MKCVIVDDEPLARKGIMLLLESYPALELAACFNDVTGATAYLQEHEADLIFLDIRMRGGNGIDFARSLGKNTMVIFVTAYAEYALDSYEVDAVDYLLKPVQPARFQQAVHKALDHASLLEQAKNTSAPEFSPGNMLVRSKRQFIRVDFKDLLFIEGLKDYVILYLPDEKIITAMNLKAIHQHLPMEHFIRVSKSYIVNTGHIRMFNNNSIRIGGQEIPIGNSFREAFFEQFVSRKP